MIDTFSTALIHGNLNLKWAWVFALLPLPLLVYVFDRIIETLTNKLSNKNQQDDLEKSVRVWINGRFA